MHTICAVLLDLFALNKLQLSFILRRATRRNYQCLKIHKLFACIRTVGSTEYMYYRDKFFRGCVYMFVDLYFSPSSYLYMQQYGVVSSTFRAVYL